jgi:type VI secretion system secreted protein VgrG
MSGLFSAEVHVVSRDLDLDFDEVIGREASLALTTARGTRTFHGVCTEIEQLRVDKDGLATYALTVAPRLALLTQRKNHRVFQYMSELAIVRKLLSEWGIEHRALVDPSVHVGRKFRVQYGESDYDFIRRMLEDAGISFFFEDTGESTLLVLADEPQLAEVQHPGLRFHDQPGVTDGSFVTEVAVGRRTRPGTQTVGDLDYRRPSTQQPQLTVRRGLEGEARLEQFDFEPGAFLYEGGGGNATPAADDRGVARTNEAQGARKVDGRLLGRRQDASSVRFVTDVIELSPGMALSIVDHPHPAATASSLLVTRAILGGRHDGDWRVRVDSVGTDEPFRPQPSTSKPRVRGLESATVVGPGDEEIHTDEYARVRVHFHWDRESQRDETSSCWVPTNQPWAGAGFGAVNLPRIGQEVLVEFLGDDPDRPVVLGRVFTAENPPAYPMPAGMKLTGLIGKSSPALVAGAGITQFQIAELTSKSWSDPPFKATPPSPISPHTSDNAFVVGDAQGGDITYIQARRDLTILAKNKWTSVVGNYRGCYVGGNDDLHVKNKQQVDVGENLLVKVWHNQNIKVGELREEKIEGHAGISALSDLQIKSDGVIAYSAKTGIVAESDETVRLVVGTSQVIVNNTSIAIKADKVDINS